MSTYVALMVVTQTMFLLEAAACTLELEWLFINDTRTIKSGKSGVLMKLYKENLSNIELGQAADYFISLLLRFYV